MIQLGSKMGIQGHVTLDLVNDGQVIRREHKNLTVNGGYSILGKLIRNEHADTDRIAYIAVGTGGHVPADITISIPPLVTDTQLEEETARAPIYLFEQISTNVVRLRTTIDKDVAQGEITEAGIFTEGGTLFARVTFPAVHKESPWYLIISWEITFSEGTA